MSIVASSRMAGAGPVADRLGEPVPRLALLASGEEDAGAEVESLRGLPGLAARLAAIAAELRLVTRAFPTWCMPEVGVGDALEQAQLVRELAHNLSAVLAGEVTSRGLGSREGLSRNDWVAAHAPTLDGPKAAELTAVGAVMREPRWGALADRVRRGETTVDRAAVIVRFHDDVVGVADREHLDHVVDDMVEQSNVLGVKELRRLVRHARMALRPQEVVDADDRRLRAGRSLTRVGRSAGLIEYRLRLDPEGAAVLDAAIDPLARPRPDLDWLGYPQPHRHPACGHTRPDEGGGVFPGSALGSAPAPGANERAADGAACQACAAPLVDPRLPATRRADALLELVGRAVAAPLGVTRTPRTKLVVTMSHGALLDQVRGAGLADNDEVLSAATVRRLACEAQILPAVLGGPSQVLDLGITERYFTPAQRLALGRRDAGCSYPGCSVPPQWCEAHHVVPWALGGTTDLDNGALLCGRHHTRVHELSLTAEVTPTGVTWQRPPPPEDRAWLREAERSAVRTGSVKPPPPTAPVRRERVGATASGPARSP